MLMVISIRSVYCNTKEELQNRAHGLKFRDEIITFWSGRLSHYPICGINVKDIRYPVQVSHSLCLIEFTRVNTMRDYVNLYCII